MQIVRVDKKNLGDFVGFADALYEASPNYVPCNRRELTKVLKPLLQNKTYVGLLAVEDGTAEGRILLTVKRNDQLDTDWCGYFCMFECLFDQDVCNELLSAAENVLKGMGAMHMMGAVPDKNFDEQAPFAVASLGKKYYPELLVNFGLTLDEEGVYSKKLGGKQ